MFGALQPYLLWIRIALAALVIAGTAYFSAHWATKVERAAWLEKQAVADAQAIAAQQESQRESAHAGVLYEQDRAKVQHVVNTPDRKLDALLQTSAGDPVVPAALGVRLNAIARAGEASAAASGPDAGMPSPSAVPGSIGDPPRMETHSGEQYRIGDRLSPSP